MVGRKFKHVGGAVLFLLLTQQLSTAAETGRLAWQTDVNEAWKITQRQRRPLLVFITHDHCVHCTRMKDGTFAERTVASTIMQSYVPVTVDGGRQSPLVKDLAVTAYPTTFVISPDAVVIDRIEGYVPPAELMARLSAAKAARPTAKLAKAP